MAMAKTTARLPLNKLSAEAVVDGRANKLNAKAGEHGRMTQGRAVDEPQPSGFVVKLSVEDLTISSCSALDSYSAPHRAGVADPPTPFVL